ncbi:MAG: hypothetical protein ACLGJB_27695 [Blastocatellia bacterium]
MIRPREELKELCNRLGRLLGSEDGHQALRIVSQIERLMAESPAAEREAASPPVNAANVTRIGIWERKQENGKTVFVRPPNADPQGYWANKERIEPKGRKKRVVLLGESVARGYFYDPYFNPATALQKMLSACAGDEFEVVDLARIDLQLEGLFELAQSSVAIGPDAFVIFAGNNWHPFQIWKYSHSSELAYIIRNGGRWKDVRHYIEEQLRLRVTSFLDRISSLCKRHSIAAVFVIPEFNLMDWRDAIGHTPLLSNSEIARWLDARDAARAALSRGDLAQAAAFADELIKLDDGLTPTGFYISAEAKLKQGQLDEARLCLELARDAGFSILVPETPRCNSATQQTLRASADQYGVALVDLPQVFKQHRPNALPDRRLFHDYCHLTIEGIQLAMASAAESLLPLLGKQSRPRNELARSPAAVDRKAIAEANFLAGTYDATWSQGYDLIRFHFEQAVEALPEFLQTMKLFLDFTIRRAPSVFCDSFTRLINTGSMNLVHRLFSDPRNEKLLNPVLITAINDTMTRHDPDAPRQVGRLLRHEHGISPEGTNLLKTGYCASPLNIEREWQKRSAYYKAYDITSGFHLVRGEDGPVEVRIAYRTPQGACEQGQVCVHVNETCVEQLAASPRWRTATFKIESGILREGLNTLQVRWPPPGPSDENPLARLAESLEIGIIPDTPHPVYGEIQTLHARRIAGVAAG